MTPNLAGAYTARSQLLLKQGAGSTYRDVFEFARFLLLCATSSEGSAGLSPSSRVDVVWHAALLFPKAYAVACESMGVGIVDHYPLRAFESEAARSERLSRTRVKYAHVFGSEPPAECWREREPPAVPGPAGAAPRMAGGWHQSGAAFLTIF